MNFSLKASEINEAFALLSSLSREPVTLPYVFTDGQIYEEQEVYKNIKELFMKIEPYIEDGEWETIYLFMQFQLWLF